MAFIDIFNFKKYFAKPSDSQVARYGHVNALYDALSQSSSQSFTTDKYLFNDLTDGDFDITTSAGEITFTIADIAPNDNVSINLNASFITEASSISIVSVGCDQVAGAILVWKSTTIDGSVNIRLYNNSAVGLTGIIINYLIIN